MGYIRDNKNLPNGTMMNSKEITYVIMDMEQVLHEHVAESNVYKTCK